MVLLVLFILLVLLVLLVLSGSITAVELPLANAASDPFLDFTQSRNPTCSPRKKPAFVKVKKTVFGRCGGRYWPPP
jgi:hypothetical protein